MTKLFSLSSTGLALFSSSLFVQSQSPDPGMHTDPQMDSIAYQIESLENDVDPRRFSGIMDMIYGVVNTSYSRKVLATMVENYGCHCFIDNSRIPGGKGPPVDQQDSLCRKLSQCHSCVSLDYQNHKKKCDPDVGNYRYTIDGTLKTISCDDQKNKDPCKRNACECDRNFALEFAKIWDDSTYNRYFWKNKFNIKAGTPTFDMDSTCQVTSFGSPKNQCCGSYPERKPFNSVLYDCCADGSVKSVGSC